jgi:nucleotide-binding universal stress UspA family protein
MSLADHSPAAGPAPAAHDSNAFRRLLVAVDDSDTAGAAASFAIWLAGTAGADVTLLHACPDLRSAQHAPPMADPAAFRAAAEHRLAETTEWQRRLQNIEDYVVAGARVRSRVVRGRPASAVLDAA